MAVNKTRSEDESVYSDSGHLGKSTTLGFAAGNSIHQQNTQTFTHPGRSLHVQLFGDTDDNISDSLLFQENTEGTEVPSNKEKKLPSPTHSSQRYGSGWSFSEDSAGARMYQPADKEVSNRQIALNSSSVSGPEKDVRFLQERHLMESNQNANASELRKSLLQQLEIVREARRGLSNEITLVESDLQQESSRIRQLRNLKQELQKKCSEIEEERIKLEDELEKTRSEAKQIFESAQELKAKKKALVVKREKLAQVCRDFDAQNQNFIQSLARENQTVHEIEQMSHKLELELNEMLRIKKKKMEEMEKIQESLAHEKKTLADLQDRYNKVEIQNISAQDSTAQLKRLIYSCEEQKNVIQKELDAAQSKKLEMEQQLYTSRAVKANMEEKIMEIKTEVLKLQTDNQMLQSEYAEQKSKFGEYQNALRQSMTEVEKRRQSLAELDSQYNNVRVVSEDLKSQYKRSQENYEQIVSEAGRAHNDLVSLNQKVKELSEKRDMYLQEREVVTQKREELNHYFSNLRHEQDQIADIQKSIDHVLEILKTSQEKSITLQTKHTEINQYLKEAHGENAKLTASLADIVAARSTKEIENERIRRDIEDTKTAIIGLEKSIQTEQRRLETLSIRYRDLQVKHDEIIHQKSKIEESTVSLNESLKSKKETLSELESETKQTKDELKKIAILIRETDQSNKRQTENKTALEESYRDAVIERDELSYSIQTWRKKNNDIQESISKYKRQIELEEGECKKGLLNLQELERKSKDAAHLVKEIEERKNLSLQHLRDFQQQKNKLSDEILAIIALSERENEEIKNSKNEYHSLKLQVESTKEAKSRIRNLIRELEELKLTEEDDLKTSKTLHNQITASIKTAQEMRGNKDITQSDYHSGYQSRNSGYGSIRNSSPAPPRSVDGASQSQPEQPSAVRNEVSAADSSLLSFDMSLNDSSLLQASMTKHQNSSHAHEKSVDLMGILDGMDMFVHRLNTHEKQGNLEAPNPPRESHDGIFSYPSRQSQLLSPANLSVMQRTMQDASPNKTSQEHASPVKTNTVPKTSHQQEPSKLQYLPDHVPRKHTESIVNTEDEAESLLVTRAESNGEYHSSNSSTKAGAYAYSSESKRVDAFDPFSRESQSPYQSRMHLSHLSESSMYSASGSKSKEQSTGQSAYSPQQYPSQANVFSPDSRRQRIDDSAHDEFDDETVNEFLRSQIAGSMSSPLSHLMLLSESQRGGIQNAFEQLFVSPSLSPSAATDQRPSQFPNAASPSKSHRLAERSPQSTYDF